MPFRICGLGLDLSLHRSITSLHTNISLAHVERDLAPPANVALSLNKQPHVDAQIPGGQATLIALKTAQGATLMLRSLSKLLVTNSRRPMSLYYMSHTI